MSGVQKFNGQRWVFADASHALVAEIAWSWEGVFQLRVTMDGETLYREEEELRMLFQWETLAAINWPGGAGERVEVQFKSGLIKVKCRLLIDGQIAPWSDYFEGKWQGELGYWPG